MYEKYDTVFAVTVDTSSKGTFVELASGEHGWIRCHLPRGVRVMATVLHIKDDGFLILALDSVQQASIAA